jgi:hypothetical protein
MLKVNILECCNYLINLTSYIFCYQVDEDADVVEDSGEEAPSTLLDLGDIKVGRKKLAKLEAKAEKKAQREAEERDREERKAKEEERMQDPMRHETMR